MESNNWLSLDWFFPERLKAFEYEFPMAFYAMIALPIVYLLVEWLKSRLSPKVPVAFRGEGIGFSIFFYSPIYSAHSIIIFSPFNVVGFSSSTANQRAR